MKVQRGKEIVETFGPFHVKDENGNWWRVYGNDGDVPVRGPATDYLCTCAIVVGFVGVIFAVLTGLGLGPA